MRTKKIYLNKGLRCVIRLDEDGGYPIITQVRYYLFGISCLGYWHTNYWSTYVKADREGELSDIAISLLKTIELEQLALKGQRERWVAREDVNTK